MSSLHWEEVSGFKDLVERIEPLDSFEEKVFEVFQQFQKRFHPQLINEDEEQFIFRIQETSREFQKSFFKSRKENWSLDGKFSSYLKHFEAKNYEKASSEISDAIFLLLSQHSIQDLANPSVLISSTWFHVQKKNKEEKWTIKEFLLLLNLKLIECLLGNLEFRKVSTFSNFWIHFMAYEGYQEDKGFFLKKFPDKFNLLQIYLCEAAFNLENFNTLISRCSEAISMFCDIANKSSALRLNRQLFVPRMKYFEKIFDDKIEELELEESCQEMSSARIVVDGKLAKSLAKNSQFFVPNLETALKIAKDGDSIFLEKGISECSKENSKKLEFTKSLTLIGRSRTESVLQGSLVKTGAGILKLKNLKLEIGGEDSDSNDDVYILEGEVLLSDCLVESPVNTAFFVLGNKSKLKFENCFLDGMENCQRFVHFQENYGIEVSVDSCYICDMFSFLTTISTPKRTEAATGTRTTATRSKLTFQNSVFRDLQDGVKVILDPFKSDLEVKVENCHFELVQYEEESTSAAVQLATNGTFEAVNNLISFNHLDQTGFSLSHLKQVKLSEILIDSNVEESRALSISQGIELISNLQVEISKVEIQGMRIGIKTLLNSKTEVKNCHFKCCSVAIQDTSNLDDSNKENQILELYLNAFETCHYGVLLENESAKTTTARSATNIQNSKLLKNSFLDVARPILIENSSSKFKTEVCENIFEVNSEIIFCESEENEKSSSEKEEISNLLFLNFAANENMAHRMAIDLDNFVSINNSEDQSEYREKYKNARI